MGEYRRNSPRIGLVARWSRPNVRLERGGPVRMVVGAGVLVFPFLIFLSLARADPRDVQEGMGAHLDLKGIEAGPFKFDLGGQVRLRYEYDNEFNVKSYKPGTSDTFLLERVMLDADMRYGPQVRFSLQLRDAHAMGSRLGREDFPQSNPFEDHADIRQAFVEWIGIGGSPLGMKVGRQQISYGDQRVFGPGLWGNTGRYAWDAVMLKADTEYVWADLWVGRFIRNSPDDWPNSAFAWPLAAVMYSHIKKLPFRLDCFYALRYEGSGAVKGEKGSGNLASHSLGFQAEGEEEPLHYAATFVHQFGSYGKDTLRAFGANAALGLSLPLPFDPRITGQFTWGSGDSDPSDGTHGTFDGVFGGADIMFYGYLNLFFWANIRDYEVDLHLAPLENVTVKVQYHYFSLDRARDAWYTTSRTQLRADPSGAAGISLGHEIDSSFTWRVSRHLEVMTAYGHFFPGTFVARTGPSPHADWACIQILTTF